MAVVISYLHHSLRLHTAWDARTLSASGSASIPTMPANRLAAPEIDNAFERLISGGADVEVSAPVPAHEVWKSITGRFIYVKAAGGIVSDPLTGKMLLIYRNGRWDLPKGHVERGETLAATALRETVEETGITPLTLGRSFSTLSGKAVSEKLATKSYHIYLSPFDSHWYLKQTSWFYMQCEGASLDRRGKPQTEEGIEAIEWVTPDEWRKRLQGSFASLRLLADIVKQ